MSTLIGPSFYRQGKPEFGINGRRACEYCGINEFPFEDKRIFIGINIRHIARSGKFQTKKILPEVSGRFNPVIHCGGQQRNRQRKAGSKSPAFWYLCLSIIWYPAFPPEKCSMPDIMCELLLRSAPHVPSQNRWSGRSWLRFSRATLFPICLWPPMRSRSTSLWRGPSEVPPFYSLPIKETLFLFRSSFALRDNWIIDSIPI